MKSAIIALLTFIAIPAHAYNDKIEHAGFGAGITFVGYWGTTSPVAGLAFGIAAGLAKEGMDKASGGTWDNKDAAATAIGSLIMYGAIKLHDLITEGK